MAAHAGMLRSHVRHGEPEFVEPAQGGRQCVLALYALHKFPGLLELRADRLLGILLLPHKLLHQPLLVLLQLAQKALQIAAPVNKHSRVSYKLHPESH